MSKPTDDLYADALRVLHYLERIKELGLTYEGDDLALHGMTDSDWAVKHSTLGVVFMLNKAAISWGSKKQTSVALSSCEAEFFTKPLKPKHFKAMRNAIKNIHSGG